MLTLKKENNFSIDHAEHFIHNLTKHKQYFPKTAQITEH